MSPSGSEAVTDRLTDCCPLMFVADAVGPAVRVGARLLADGGATGTSTWACVEPPRSSEIVTFSVKIVEVVTTGEIHEGLDTKRLLKEPTGVAGSWDHE